MMKEYIDACLEDDYLMDASDVQSIKRAIINFMIHGVGKDPEYAGKRDWFYALAYLLRSLLSERYIRTCRNQDRHGVKRVYYLSMEYLIGKTLSKTLLDMGLKDVVAEALEECGQDLDDLASVEFDAALGNGGLGRLAACFLDSLATHGYPGFGYGIRYEYGMFTQRLEQGQQVEHPENWLRYGNPWEFERPSVIHTVRFNGRLLCFKDERGEEVCQWVDTDEVIAMAFDIPVSGFGVHNVTNLRLWSARSTRDFDLSYFNEGNYIEAVKNKTHSENLSKVLYPNDKNQVGQELRLKQEYFFVSASVQDLLDRFARHHAGFEELPDKVAIQLNDTHPALAVPELMRILMDTHGYGFDAAWDITTRTMNYTNHTLLPEALEVWPIDMLGRVLPRHLELIYQINDHFLRQVRYAFPGDPAILRRVSLVDDDHRTIRMAHLAIVGSGKVNGVAELHTKLLRQRMFPDFDRLYPGKFVNMTNGITPRRWLLESNPGLSQLIGERIGENWTRDLSLLRQLDPLAEEPAFRDAFAAVKHANKERLASRVEEETGIVVDPGSLFDVQVKRIHEYKRQLLNLLHVVVRYNRLRSDPDADLLARTVIIAGKAAPGYWMAKLIVRLISDVADTVNNDPATRDRLKLVFFPDYKVSAAEWIIPGSDLSEQISTAGTEASGTGNMKFALNGAVTIGTLDGANIEIQEEVGDDNIFIFGLDAAQATELRAGGYDPYAVYERSPELKQALDMIGGGYFSPEETGRYKPIFDALLRHGDHFLLCADFAAYLEAQAAVDAAYRDEETWTRMAIRNVARVGKFSSDRTIHSYASDIWDIKSLVL